MGSSTGVRHERQEVSSTDNPRVKGSNPATGNFFAEFICSNTILADLPEPSTLGKPRMTRNIPLSSNVTRAGGYV